MSAPIPRDISTLPIRALLVEDEPEAALLTARRLDWSSEASFRVAHESTLDGAVAHLEREPCDVMVLDVGLPDVRGLSTIAHASILARHVPIVVLSGCEEPGMQDAARQAGMANYLVKDDQDSRSLSRALLRAICAFERRMH